MKKISVFLLAALVAGCVAYLVSMQFRKEKPTTKPGTNEVKGRENLPVPAVKFTDITKDTGIAFKHMNGATGAKLLPETMGGGVAVFDYDGDGKPDILFIQSGVLPGHGQKADIPTMALYRNLGNNKFDDVTKAVGLNVPMYGMGVCVGDIDNDGWPDVFISCIGKHHLFRNVSGKKFEDVTATAGVGGGPDLVEMPREKFLESLDPIPFGSSATFVDYDGDGRLDLFVGQYITWSPKIDRNVTATLVGVGRAYVPPRDFNGAYCKLYRNIDGSKFVDVSKEAGIEVYEAEGTDAGSRLRPVGKSLGVIICDPDEDGWPDLMVANDGVRNFFFHNETKDGKRVFVECARDCGAAYPDDGTPRGGMGIDYAQFHKGLFAACITNFANEANTFLRQTPHEKGKPKETHFLDTALTYGLQGPSRSPLKFGLFFFDYDNDGRLDLLSCNGHIEPDIGKTQGGQTYMQAAQLFWNTGEEKPVFQQASKADAGEDLFKPIVGRGSAYADLDGDGDLDVILCNNNGAPLILRNDNDLKHHWVRLALIGDGKTSSTSAIGATVTIEADGQRFTRTVSGARGYLSQSEAMITVGLGKATKIDRVRVQWPGKATTEETFTIDAVDKVYTLKQGSGAKAK